MAFVNVFLKLDGVTGESVNPAHRGEIDVESYTFGVSVSAVTTTGVGKSLCSDVTFVAMQSSATIALLERAVRGTVILTGRLTLRTSTTATSTSVVFATVDLQNVRVTSVNEQWGGDRPQTLFSLNYGRVTWTYTSVAADLTVGRTVTTTWNQETQTPT